ncbi:MAG: pantoate--beta-alanine ligase [Actinomycetales bacterium]|nr:pantoate--beta-alanine ligase [Actinomycetales bacterium]
MNDPVVIETIAGLRATLAGREVAFVPTMGALHEGHLTLVREALELAPTVVVSIFVNPTQFGRGEDLDRYPRDLEGDLAKLAAEGVEVVFAPSAEEMYPPGGAGTTVVGGPVAGMFEGRARPGHFTGVLTVVSKLLHIVQPKVAVFGRKDAQQLFLVGAMVRDLDLPVRIHGAPTARDADGLALSSRNRFLSPEQRLAARALPRALEAASSAADGGVDAVVAAAQSVLMDEELLSLDYLAVVDPATFLPVSDDHRGVAKTIVAAKVGDTRLIDNDDLYLNPAR